MESNNHTSAILCVEGTDIPCNVVFHEERGYVELPLLATIEALGYSVSIFDNDCYVMDVEGKKYYADLESESLVAIDDPHNENIIIPTPGETFQYKETRNNDIYIDQQTMRTVFRFLDVDAIISVDFSNKNVVVSFRKW